MKCEICQQNEATIIIKGEVAGQVRRELHICSTCAAQYGLDSLESGGIDGMGLVDLLHSLAEKMAVETANGLSLSLHGYENLKCERCGLTIKDLRQKSKLGCEECYTTFSPVLLDALRDMHKDMTHVPRNKSRVKRPGTDGVVNLTLQMNRLRKELTDAVKNEHFEVAAMLRDQIAELKTKLDKMNIGDGHLPDLGIHL